MNSKFTCTIVTFTLLCGLSYVSFAQGTTVDRLEKRINDLEKRVALLEQRLADVQRPVTPGVQKSKDKSVWRTLQKGMTKSEIQAVLGEPLNIDVGGSLTYWFYSKQSWHSYVIFDDSGVYGWKEPE